MTAKTNIAWRTDFEDALAEAKLSDSPLYIDFFKPT
jgi:hypothetical protein